MIYVDGNRVGYEEEWIELKDSKGKITKRKVFVNPYASEVMKRMEEFIGSKKIEKPLIVQYPDELTTYAYTDTGVKKAQYPASKVIPLIANITNANGILEEWIYSETPLMVKDGVVKVVKPLLDWNPSSSIVIEQRNFELAFFLKFKSKFCKDGAVNEGRYFFEFENKAKRASVEVASKQERLKVEYAINVDLSEDKLRILARAYHIPNEFDKSKDELRESLSKLVLINNVSMKKFMVDAKIGKTVKFKALVQEAIDKKIVVRTASGKAPYWAFASEDNKEGAKICDIPISQVGRANVILVDFLQDNTDLAKMIEDRLK